MKERPILFNGEMVRAILSGAKTQTRRVVKILKQKHDGNNGYMFTNPSGQVVRQQCPHGIPGDRLWVRETFVPCVGIGSTKATIFNCIYVTFKDGGQKTRKGEISEGLKPFSEYAPGAFDYIKWKPSIHMPRWASRINLEITNVRVERIQDISEDDAICEGVTRSVNDYEDISGIDCLERLWDSINKKRGFGWDKNPWVWVIEFKIIKKPQHS